MNFIYTLKINLLSRKKKELKSKCDRGRGKLMSWFSMECTIYSCWYVGNGLVVVKCQIRDITYRLRSLLRRL